MDKVVHFEVPFDDAERAQKFYRDVFGWEIKKFPGDVEYYNVNTVEVDDEFMPKESGAINGGLAPRDETGKSPIIVINVSSIDEYVKRIAEAGGEIVMEKGQITDMGFYARVKDSEGNIIGIWEDLKK